jgi:hypothetical protein
MVVLSPSSQIVVQGLKLDHSRSNPQPSQLCTLTRSAGQRRIKLSTLNYETMIE